MTKRLLLLVAGAALLSSACIKVNLSVEVKDDGSGTVEGLVAVDFEAFAELAGTFGEDAGFGQDEVCSDFETESGIEGSEFDQVSPYNEGGFCGTEFSTSFGPGELQAALGGLDAGTAGIEQVAGGGWRFDMDLNADSFDSSDTEGIPGFEDIFDGAEYVVRVKLPGRQVDHNGSFIDNEGFVVWDIDFANPPDRLFLVTEPGETEVGSSSAFDDGGGGGGGAGMVIIIVVLALAALGIAAYFLTRNKDDDETAAAGAPPVVPTAPPVADQVPATQDFTTPADQVTPPPAVAEDLAATADPAVIASPTPDQATGEPVWDPSRRKYVQWDPNKNVWLIFDDATQSWTPEA